MAEENPPLYPDDDRTVFIPRPGGRGPAAAPPVPPPPAAFSQPQRRHVARSGANPLLSAASPLIALVNQLRNTLAHQDIDSLRRQVIEEVKAFENQARIEGTDPDTAYTARYLLCAVLDEIVLNTVWGSTSIWASQGLMSTLHNETRGGEKFFVILDRLLKDPNANLELLELIFVCISLGFKGRYRIMHRGQEKLDELRSVLFEQIRRRRGEFPKEFSLKWEGIKDQRSALRRYVPLWVVLAVAGLLLLSVFVGFTVVLEDTAEPVYNALEEMGSASEDLAEE